MYPIAKISRILFALPFLFLLHEEAVAQNKLVMAGGSISYTHVGGDTFSVLVELYGDCGGGSPSISGVAVRTCGGAFAGNLAVTLLDSADVSGAVCSTTNCDGGGFSGRKSYRYSAVFLDTFNGGGNCFELYANMPNASRRNTAIMNINPPTGGSTSNFTVSTIIHTGNGPINSSPRFSETLPIPYVCASSSIDYTPTLTNPGNDSLVFSLDTAQRISGGVPGNIAYVAGFSALVPIPGITINSATGQLLFTAPATAGKYQVVILVQEYDKTTGNLKSAVHKDFQFVVNSGCSNGLPVADGSLTNLSNAVLNSNYEVTLTEGTSGCFSLAFTDPDGDTLELDVTDINTVLPAATVDTFNFMDSVVVQVCWNPTAGDVGTYTIIPSVSDNQCPLEGTASQAITVHVQSAAPPLVLDSVVATNGLCSGEGQLAVFASGGSGSYQYIIQYFDGGVIQDTLSTNVFSGLATNSYDIKIIDLTTNDSVDTVGVIIFNSFASVQLIAPSGILSTCFDSCSGNATVNHILGGPGAVSYLWSPSGETTKTATNLCTDTNFVTVTKGTCLRIDTIIISEFNFIDITIDSIHDVACNGGSDGDIFITPSGGGGFGSATYAWTGGATTQDLLNRPIGTYTVTVTDNNGCTNANSATIAQPTALAIDSTVNTDPSCVGATDGTATVFPSGGTAGYTYAWSSGGAVTSQTNTGLAAGTYTVTVTDANGCTITASTTLTDAPALLITLTPTNALCLGDSSGFIVASGALTYVWNTGATGDTLANIPAGTYTVTATGSGGCTATADTTVGEPATAVSASITSVTNVLCFGDSTGVATANGTGGTGSKTFLWPASANNQTTATATGLAAGSYVVTVTDANGCTATATATITQPATAVSVSITSQTNVLCFGNTTGAATANASGGSGSGYTYAWSGGLGSGATKTNLAAGTYTVTASDGNGCTTTTSVTITQPDSALAGSIASQTNVTCNGLSNGSATVTQTGGTSPYTYAWNGGGTAATKSGLAAGNHTVTITDNNGCSTTVNITITQPAALAVTFTTDSASCSGGNDGSSEANPTGGTSPYSYSWCCGQGSDSIADNLSAGTYTVTVTDDNGCTITASSTVGQPTALTIATINATDETCIGAGDGSVTASASGGTSGYSFTWMPGSLNGATQNGLSAGVYTVVVEDANGCTVTDSVEVEAPNSGPTVTLVAAQNPLCFGQSNGSITVAVSGGTTPYDYAWNGSGSGDSVRTNLAAGTYTVTVSDANGCEATLSDTLTAPAMTIVAANVTTNIVCSSDNNGVITAIAFGGTTPYTFNWSTGASATGVASHNITGLVAGTYTVTLTDANGCTSTEAEVVGPGATIALNPVVTDESCGGMADGEIDLTPSGATTYTFNWLDITSGAEPEDRTGLTAGTYTVTVTGNNGCTASANITVGGAGGLVLTLSKTDLDCNGDGDGTITATVSGGTTPYDFIWSDIGSNGSANPNTRTGLSGGVYAVTLEDDNGCEIIDSIEVIEPAALALTTAIDQEVSCNGAADGEVSVTITGGTTPYDVDWSNSANTEAITGLTGGTYTVTVADDNGCTAVTALTLVNPPAIFAQVDSMFDPSCANNDGQAYLSAYGGQSTSNGTANYHVVQNTINFAPYGMDVEGATQFTLGDDAITGLISIGFNFEFFGNTQTDFRISTNGNIQFPTSASAAFSDQAIPNAGVPNNWIGIWDDLNPGVVTTEIIETYLGGAAPHRVRVINYIDVPHFNETSASNHTFQIVLHESSNIIEIHTVTAPAVTSESGSLPLQKTMGIENATGSFGVPVPGRNATNFTLTNDYVAFIPMGQDFDYLWADANTDSVRTDLGSGNHCITITDPSGNLCDTVVCFTLDSPDTFGLALTATSLCAGGTATITATPSGTAGPFGFEWSTTETSSAITVSTTSTFTVTVTDSTTGCVLTADTALTFGTPPVATASQINPDSCGDGVGSATVSGTNFGTSPAFLWSNASTAQTAVGLDSGTYTVIVTNDIGCSDTASVFVDDTCACTINATLASQQNVNCFGGNDGAINITITGATGSPTFAWDNSATTQNIASLEAGTYCLIVTDSVGCVDDDLCVTITEPAAFGASIALDNGLECDTTNAIGEMTASATGGTAPYSFAWSSGGNAATETNLSAGTYTVTVEDDNGCTTTANASFTSAPVSVTSPVITTNDTTLCTAATITLNGTGGGNTTFTASADAACSDQDGTGSVMLGISNIPATATANGTLTLTFSGDLTSLASLEYLSVFDETGLEIADSLTVGASCGTNTVNISATAAQINAWAADNSAAFEVRSAGGAEAECSGNAFCVEVTSFTFPKTADAAYWFEGAFVQDTAQAIAAGASVSVSPAVTTTYYYATFNGLCFSDPDSVVVTIGSPVTITAVSVTQPSCDNACDGAATATVSGGTGTYTFAWTGSASTTSTANALCGGGHTVIAADQNGCADTALIALVEPPAIWVTLDSTDSATCTAADGKAFLSAHGGFAASTSTTSYIIDQTEGSYEPYPYGQPLNATGYQTLTLADDANSAAIPVFGGGGSFQFFGQNKTQFVVSSQGLVTFDLSQVSTGQVNGMFSTTSTIPFNGNNLDPRDFIGAYWNDLDPSVGNATIETYVLGTTPNRVRVVNYLNLRPFGAANDNNASTFQIVLYETSNIIQIHSDSLRHDGDNRVQGIENAAENVAFAVPGRNNTVFTADNDYVAFIPAQQNFTWAWSNGGNTTSSDTALAAGTYTVTASNGACSDDTTFTIEVQGGDLAANLQVLQGVSCTAPGNTGELASVPTGGDAPYTFAWSTSSTNDTISDLFTGTYTVTVTDDNGCQDSATATLANTSNSITPPTITTGDTSVCPNTSFTLEGETNTTGTFTATSSFVCTNSGTGFSLPITLSNVPSTAIGPGTLTVTGVGGLAGGFSFLLVASESGNIGNFQGASVNCDTSTQVYNNTTTFSAANINTWAANGSVVFTFTNVLVPPNSCGSTSFCVQATFSFPTAPDTSYWFAEPLALDTALAIGSGDSVTTSASTSTTYYYATFNGLCWSVADSVQVDILPALTPTITQNTAIACPGDSASLTASGGAGSFIYSWPTGATTASVNLPAGTWCVTVTDVSGNTCPDTACITLTDPAAIVLNPASTAVSCFGGNDGSASANASGGNGTFSYAWSNSGNTATINGLTAGVYTVTVTSGGCDVVDSVTVTEPTELVLDMDTVNISCAGGNDGQATVTPSGGTPNYDFLWSNAQTTQSITGLAAGTYTVTVTDDNGCTETGSVIVAAPAALSAAIDSIRNNDCFGASDGFMHVATTGGTAPYTFAWSGSASTLDSTNNLAAGTYTVTVTDDNGCTATASGNITQPATGMTVSIVDTTHVLCHGGSNGQAVAEALNTTGAVGYVWTNGSLIDTAANLTAGTYTVTATDATGCTASQSVTITEPGAIAVTATATDVSCFGGSDGTLSASATNAVGTTTYTWDNGAGTGQNITGQPAGTYNVTVTDDNGCTATGTATIGAPAAIVLDMDTTNASCSGGNDGQATVTPSGGAGGFSFLWSTTATTSTITGLATGTYTVTVTDANGCTSTDSVEVTAPTALTAVIDSIHNNDCFGASDGYMHVATTGGTAPYTFVWNGSASTLDSATNLAAGTYTVTVTDDNGCTATADSTITQPATGMTVSIVDSTDVLCNGGSNGQAVAEAVNATGAVSYVWTNGSLIDTAANLAAGTYTVTATDATGCTASQSVSIDEPEAIIVTAIGTNPSCNGGSDGEVTATAVNAVGTPTYTWDNGLGAGQTFTGLVAGTYNLTVTDDNGCTGTDDVTLTNPAGMTASFSNIGVSGCILCTGDATVSITGDTVGPLVYAWPSTETSASATQLCDGMNLVTVTDNGTGCLDSFAVFIPSDSADTVIAFGIDPTCNGGCDGQVFTDNTCSGGCTFVWTDSATSAVVGNTDTVTGLCAGTYIVEMTNGNGCVSIDTVVLGQPAPIVVTITTSINVTCFGGNDGSATANATGGAGGFSYAWSGGGTGATKSSLTAGTYTVTATDVNGCTSITSVTITQPATGISLVAVVDSNASCNGVNDGGVSATASGGTGAITFQWSDGTFSQSGPTWTGLPAGTYTVTATDALGCTSSQSVTVTQPTVVAGVLDSTHNPTCFGLSDGDATVHGSGGTAGYTYLWSNGSTVVSATGLAAGNHTVTITDANGCEGTLTVTLTDPAQITNTFSNIDEATCLAVPCNGEVTANPANGQGSTYTFVWDNGGTAATNDSLCAGVRTVTITDSAGCELIAAVAISDSGSTPVTADSVDASCGACDGQAIATYNCVGCSLEWFALGSGTTIGTADTILGLCAGTYFVELTNASGCISADETEIHVPAEINPNAVLVNESCNGAANGSITLSPTGGSGVFTFAWSNSATTSSITGLSAGTYTVTVSDNAGCDTVETYVITAPTAIVLNSTVSDAACFASCDGQIALVPTSGTSPYAYNWNPVPGNGQGVSTATGLCAGNYDVTVTDFTGCSVTATITVGSPTQITQTAVVVTNAECGVCDGSVEPQFAGGAGTYTLAWSTGSTNDTISGLCLGLYEVTVTDAALCTATFNYPVSETGGPTISLSGINATANGACDGEATVTVVSSTGTVTFLWNTGSTNATITGLCAGQYVVTATDANGCATIDTITITQPTALALAFVSTDITCAGGGCDGEIIAIVSGGVTPYTYAWSNSETTDTITGLCAGTYIVTVTDDNGAQIIDSVTLVNPTPFVITALVVDETCQESCDGSIALTITGGSITGILWNTGDTTAAIDSLCEGAYTVTVSDTSGCEQLESFVVGTPPDITLATVNMQLPDCQVANGSVEVAASGGNGGAFGYVWLDVNMDTLVPSQTTTTATNLFAGIYNVAVTDVKGCTDTFVVTLNNNNAANIALDSIHHVSCFGLCDGMVEVTLTGGTLPYTIQWSSGGTFEDDSNLCAGADTLSVSDSNLCLSFAIFEVTEPSELLITGIGATNVQCGEDCNGIATVEALGGTLPYTFAWSNGSTDTTATELCVGTYTVTITDGNGCQVVGTATVNGPQPLALAVDSTDAATCEYTGDGSVYVTVSGGTLPHTFTWVSGDGETTLNGTDLINVLPGTYALTVMDANGCNITNAFFIETENRVVATVGDDFSVCPDSRGVEIIGSDSFATAVRWLSEDGVVQSKTHKVEVDALSDTSVFVFEAFNGICVARDTLRILYTEGPGIDAGLDYTIEPGNEVTIGGSPTANAGVNVVWTPARDLSSVTDENPTAFPLVTTIYYVSGTDADGCFGIDSMTVTVENLVGPVDGFSPNGDGVNDLFYIARIDRYPKAVVSIVNRWGNQLFVSNPGYTNPWDGTFNGKPLSVGTYYYIIDLNDDSVTTKLVTGPVTILK